MSRLLPSHRHVVDVAPSPVLARLEGLDNWMAGLLVMGGRVTVRRRVAASDVPAGQAEPQMYPAVPRRKALGTSLRSERVDRLQTDDVFACGGHVSRDYFRLRMWRPRLPGHPLRAGRLDEPGRNHDYHGNVLKQDASPSEPGSVHDQRRTVGVVRRLPRSAPLIRFAALLSATGKCRAGAASAGRRVAAAARGSVPKRWPAAPQWRP
jgi:hypothetical protein